MIRVLGILVFITGFYIRYRVKRRRYYRRIQPVQRISYERKVLRNVSEEFLHLLYYLLITLGVLIFSFGWYGHKELKNQKMTNQFYPY